MPPANSALVRTWHSGPMRCESWEVSTAAGVGTATCGGEDLAMLLEMLMAGRTLGYEPSAIVHHSHRRGLIEDLESELRGYGIGFSAMMLARRGVSPSHSGVPRRSAPRTAGYGQAGLSEALEAEFRVPSGVARAELRGMFQGPAAYVRGYETTRHGPDESTTG